MSSNSSMFSQTDNTFSLKSAETELIKRSLAGDQSAYQRLVIFYMPRVRVFIGSRLSRENQDIDDLAQEVFITAWNSLGNYTSGSSFRSWLIGIAHNHIRNHWRKLKHQESKKEQLRRESDEILFADFDFDLEGARAELAMKRLRQCLGKLPHKSMLAISQRYFHGKKVQDIASDWNMASSQVSTVLFRSRHALRICLEKGGVDEKE